MLELNFYTHMLIRLLLACVIGIIIGIEREGNNRNAGLRTHVLVCVASTMVMCMSEFIFFKYSHASNFDPARLGAEVVKGIGFLGAGCIINERLSARGLTTAAAVWISACIGLAIGSGLYIISILTTSIMILTLIKLKKIESTIIKKNRLCLMFLKIQNSENVFVELSKLFKDTKIKLKDLSFITEINDDTNSIISVKVLIKVPSNNTNSDIINKVLKLPNILEATVK